MFSFGRSVFSTLGLVFAMALLISVPGAQASHFDNDALVDVRFGPTAANGGTSLDSNVAEFRVGIQSSGGCFSAGCVNYPGAHQSPNTNGRSVYSFRSVDGSFSNSNGAGTRVFVEWLMTEPDGWKLSNKSASLSQKSFVQVRAILYDPGASSRATEVEACGVKAQTKHDELVNSPNDVKIQLKCKPTVWEELGFSAGQIDQIEGALGKASKGVTYIFKAP